VGIQLRLLKSSSSVQVLFAKWSHNTIDPNLAF
jgi:hypothetical protein